MGLPMGEIILNYYTNEQNLSYSATINKGPAAIDCGWPFSFFASFSHLSPPFKKVLFIRYYLKYSKFGHF